VVAVWLSDKYTHRIVSCKTLRIGSRRYSASSPQPVPVSTMTISFPLRITTKFAWPTLKANIQSTLLSSNSFQGDGPGDARSKARNLQKYWLIVIMSDLNLLIAVSDRIQTTSKQSISYPHITKTKKQKNKTKQTKKKKKKKKKKKTLRRRYKPHSEILLVISLFEYIYLQICPDTKLKWLSLAKANLMLIINSWKYIA